MHIVSRYSYSDAALPGFQVIKLPFAEATLSMIVVLTTSNTSGSQTSADVIGALPNLKRTKVDLKLTKFKFESCIERI